MNTITAKRPYKEAGFFAIISVGLFALSQIYLQSNFDWEGQPFETIFAMYQAHMPWIKVIWLMFAVGSMMIIPTALLFHSCFGKEKLALSKIGVCFGIIAGFSYTIGVMRWVLLADSLSASYVATKDPVVLKIFAAFNTYAGNGFGETIAPISHAVWIICLGICMYSDKTLQDRMTKILALLFPLFGAFIAMRPAEYFGFKSLGELGDFALMIWAVVFLFYGMYLFFGRKKSAITPTKH